ncbi:hypothetical protein MMC28_001849 [Mycoblastus sanguinarius]|nr:hypothetical protein [Mycoblastus sanguinarius]
MFWPGLANVAAGVAIDLSSITNVTVSPDRKTTSAGGDARWGAIYSQLDARNLSIVGGRVFDIGIGGFALGGMRIFVLASGEVVNANASQHSDLYKALKGGGNKFGVVTRFDFKTFDFGTFWGGLLVVPTHNSKRQLEALQDFTKASGAVTDNYSAIESIHAYNSPGQTALGIGNGGRYVWATGMFANNATMLAKVNELAQATSTDLSTKEGNYTFSNVFQPIPRSITGNL